MLAGVATRQCLPPGTRQCFPSCLLPPSRPHHLKRNAAQRTPRNCCGFAVSPLHRAFGNAIANIQVVQVSMAAAMNRSSAPAVQDHPVSVAHDSFLDLLSTCGKVSEPSTQVPPSNALPNSAKAISREPRERKQAGATAIRHEYPVQNDASPVSTLQPWTFQPVPSALLVGERIAADTVNAGENLSFDKGPQLAVTSREISATNPTSPSVADSASGIAEPRSVDAVVDSQLATSSFSGCRGFGRYDRRQQPIRASGGYT